jgi:hypothetical protein
MVQNCLLLLKKYSPEFYDILIGSNPIKKLVLPQDHHE